MIFDIQIGVSPKIIFSSYILLSSLALSAGAEPIETPEQTVHERSAVIEQWEGGGIETFYNSNTGWVRVQLCRPTEARGIQACSRLHDGNLDINAMDRSQAMIVSALKAMRIEIQEEYRTSRLRRVLGQKLKDDANYIALTNMITQIDRPQGLKLWLRADLNAARGAARIVGVQRIQEIADILRRAFHTPTQNDEPAQVSVK